MVRTLWLQCSPIITIIVLILYSSWSFKAHASVKDWQIPISISVNDSLTLPRPSPDLRHVKPFYNSCFWEVKMFPEFYQTIINVSWISTVNSHKWRHIWKCRNLSCQRKWCSLKIKCGGHVISVSTTWVNIREINKFRLITINETDISGRWFVRCVINWSFIPSRVRIREKRTPFFCLTVIKIIVNFL